MGWFCCWYNTLQNICWCKRIILLISSRTKQGIIKLIFYLLPYRAPSIGISLWLLHGVPIRYEGIVHLPLCREASPQQVEPRSRLGLGGHRALKAPDGSTRARRRLAQRHAAVVQPACTPSHIFNDGQVIILSNVPAISIFQVVDSPNCLQTSAFNVEDNWGSFSSLS